MGLTDNDKYLLNNFMGQVAHLVQLGTKLDAALDAALGQLPEGSVSEAELANSSVSVNKLTVALRPSHVAKFAGTFTTVGGDANEEITVAGALATDIVVLTVKTAGATPRSIVSAAAGVDKIDVVMSDDPSNDHVLQYVVFRSIS